MQWNGQIHSPTTRRMKKMVRLLWCSSSAAPLRGKSLTSASLCFLMGGSLVVVVVVTSDVILTPLQFPWLEPTVDDIKILCYSALSNVPYTLEILWEGVIAWWLMYSIREQKTAGLGVLRPVVTKSPPPFSFQQMSIRNWDLIYQVKVAEGEVRPPTSTYQTADIVNHLHSLFLV